MNLDSRITPKKSLGQHFLRSEKALQTIIENISANSEVVFEIGPGEGVLTKKILELNKKVFAIEIDKRSIELLRKKFALEIAEGKLFIIEKDCLEVEYGEYLAGIGGGAKGPAPEYSLVGNIPYYITGAIFRNSFEQKVLPKEIIFLIQKEVAQRIVASNKKESILSISIKIFSKEVKILDIVKAGSFVPPPKVDSAILKIGNIKNVFVSTKKRDDFFKIMKAAFSQKRKFALSNIKNVLGEEKKSWAMGFIGEKQRAEDIALNVWEEMI